MPSIASQWTRVDEPVLAIGLMRIVMVDGLLYYTDDASIAEAGQFALDEDDGEPMIESFDGGAPELTPLRFYGLAGIPHVLIPEAA